MGEGKVKWDYGGAYLRYPCENRIIRFSDGSIARCHDIFRPLPDFMRSADVIFTDSPWNTGNIRSFYTKAGMIYESNFRDFMERLFRCVEEISPCICYLVIGKEFLADYIIRMRKLYKYVTFYNSSYYHNANNHCYVVRGAHKAKKPSLDGVDEEDIFKWVCANEIFDCIGDLCMGRGFVGIEAVRNGKRFVGTELNHKRLSVLLEKMDRLGIKYKEVLEIDN